MPFYPIVIDAPGGQVSTITDWQGCAQPVKVCSGDTLTVLDGNDARVRTTFDLDWKEALYDFVLPYQDESADGNCLLRVVEAEGRSSEGTTVIMHQDETRIMAHLDSMSEMCFDYQDFDDNKDIDIDLYSLRRTFPKLSIRLEKKEQIYELREVDGPTPWWKIALEVLLVFASVGFLAATYQIWQSLLQNITPLFT